MKIQDEDQMKKKNSFYKKYPKQQTKCENTMHSHNREVKGTNTKMYNHAKKCKYNLCNKAKQTAPTSGFTVILRISQY